MQKSDTTPDLPAAKILQECIDIMEEKGKAYQSGASGVKQAEYYPRGADSIYDMMNTKLLRIKSVLSLYRIDSEVPFESLEDSCRDLINYTAFMIAYQRGQIDGQHPDRDLFNREKEDQF